MASFTEGIASKSSTRSNGCEAVAKRVYFHPLRPVIWVDYVHVTGPARRIQIDGLYESIVDGRPTAPRHARRRRVPVRGLRERRPLDDIVRDLQSRHFDIFGAMGREMMNSIVQRLERVNKTPAISSRLGLQRTSPCPSPDISMHYQQISNVLSPMQVDFNKLSIEDATALKRQMEEEFERTRVKINDPNFVYDKRVDYALYPRDDENDWDEEESLEDKPVSLSKSASAKIEDVPPCMPITNLVPNVALTPSLVTPGLLNAPLSPEASHIDTDITTEGILSADTSIADYSHAGLSVSGLRSDVKEAVSVPPATLSAKPSASNFALLCNSKNEEPPQEEMVQNPTLSDGTRSASSSYISRQGSRSTNESEGVMEEDIEDEIDEESFSISHGAISTESLGLMGLQSTKKHSGLGSLFQSALKRSRSDANIQRPESPEGDVHLSSVAYSADFEAEGEHTLEDLSIADEEEAEESSVSESSSKVSEERETRQDGPSVLPDLQLAPNKLVSSYAPSSDLIGANDSEVDEDSESNFGVGHTASDVSEHLDVEYADDEDFVQ